MNNILVTLALTSVLLPLQAHAADMAAPAAAPDVTFAFTTGAVDFVLPARQTGVFSSGNGSFNNTNSAGLIGGQIGVSANKDLGAYGDFDLAVGANAFVDVVHASSGVTDSFTGPGVVVIPGYTTPANTTISLATNGASTSNPASADVSHTSPGNELENVDLASNLSGTVDQWAATTQSPDSFALGAITSQHGAVNAAGAYGAVGATDGGIFIGSGDLTGLKVTTITTTDLIYTGMDITGSASGKPANGMVFQVYGGPSYRYLNDHTDTVTSVDIPEVAPVDPSNYFPTYSMDRNETLSSHYLGGIAGLNVVQQLGNGMSVAFNGEGGLYYTASSLTGTESYSIAGGLNTSVTPATIQNANGINQSANGLAYAARAGSSVSMPIMNGLQLTLGGNVEYLSRVAYTARSSGSPVTSSAAPFGVSSDHGTTTYNGAGSSNTLIAFGDMWNFGASASLSGHF
jgi:hypothetical protein